MSSTASTSGNAYNTFRQDAIFFGSGHSFESIMKNFFFNSRINLFFICIFPAVLCYHASLSKGATLFFCILSLVPISERLNFTTSVVLVNSQNLNCLQVPLCSINEIIITSTALYFGLKRFLMLYTIGSSLVHVIFILGTSFVFSGWAYDTVRYHTNMGHIYSMFLLYFAASITIPEILYQGGESSFLQVEGFSRAIAIVSLLVYCSYACFQNKTHPSFYSKSELLPTTSWIENETTRFLRNYGIAPSAVSSAPSPDDTHSSNHHQLRLQGSNRMQIGSPVPSVDHNAIIEPIAFEWSTNFIIFLTGYFTLMLLLFVWMIFILTDILSNMSSDSFLMGVSPTFIVTILLPLVTNLFHLNIAVDLAKRKKFSDIIHSTMKPSLHITMLVLPCMVMLSWITNVNLTFSVGVFESSVLFMAALVVNTILRLGESNWLVGLTLVTFYLAVAIGFWARSNDSL